MSLTQYLTATAAICAAIWAIAAATESVARGTFRENFEAQIRNFDLAEWLRQVPSEILIVFGAVFGERWFSWKFFLRSCALSVALLFCTTVLFVAGSENYSWSIFWKWNVAGAPAWYYLPIAAAYNLGADYFSLLETIWIISLMSRARSLKLSALLLLLDFVASALIFTFWSAFVRYMATIHIGDWIDVGFFF